MPFRRYTAAVLAVAAWFLTGCLLMAPSHACCQKNLEKLSAQIPACCISPTVAQALDSSSSAGGDGHFISVSNFIPSPPLISVGDPAIAQSLWDHRHLADQSNRYLELRVLLN